MKDYQLDRRNCSYSPG